jgi:HD-like signal output (HDOD) protein
LPNINDPSLLESADEKTAVISKSAETIVRSQSENLSPSESLLNSIDRDTDFPTFSKHIVEINRQISSAAKYSSASDLSNAILKDYALTGKLLKLVNSAFYSVTGGKVTTITRAVVLLGYETVRMAATSLLLFDLMISKSSAAELKEAFVKAFWSALIAKETADSMSVKDNEEAFICAMLHNLGKHIVLLYLPDKWAEISNLILNQGFSKVRASKAVLGISFENVGIAVAKRWNFPPGIINSMELLSGEDLQNRKGKVDVLQVLSNFSNELCSVINNTNGEKRKESLSELTSQYKNHVFLSPKQLTSMIEASLEKVKKHADLIDFDIERSRFFRRLTVGTIEHQLDHKDQSPDKDLNPEVSKVFVGGRSNPDASDNRLSDAKQTDPVEVILSGVQDMSAAMLGEFKVNDIALMALESMYRGLAFNRVIFFTMRKDRKQLEARFGFGSGIERIVNQLCFETNGTSNIFNIALAKGKDLIIEDADQQHVKELIPEWFRQKIHIPAFIFLPVTYDNTCLGAFYADRKNAGPPLQAGQYKYVTMLRNQLILAVKYRT